jgi:hypothetical protein
MSSDWVEGRRAARRYSRPVPEGGKGRENLQKTGNFARFRERAIKTLQKPFHVIQLSHAAKTMLGAAPA